MALISLVICGHVLFDLSGHIASPEAVVSESFSASGTPGLMRPSHPIAIRPTPRTTRRTTRNVLHSASGRALAAALQRPKQRTTPCPYHASRGQNTPRENKLVPTLVTQTLPHRSRARRQTLFRIRRENPGCPSALSVCVCVMLEGRGIEVRLSSIRPRRAGSVSY